MKGLQPTVEKSLRMCPKREGGRGGGEKAVGRLVEQARAVEGSAANSPKDVKKTASKAGLEHCVVEI